MERRYGTLFWPKVEIYFHYDRTRFIMIDQDVHDDKL